MGQAHSIPQTKPPPLSDDTDDSEEEEVLLLDPILSNEKGEEKGEEVSIVFFDEDEEEVNENDLYYDEDRNDDTLDDYKCFGLPFFSMTAHLPAIALPSDKAKSNNGEDEDEDPKENIESLQFELKVVDAFYNHHARNANKTTKKSSEEEKERIVGEVKSDLEKETTQKQEEKQHQQDDAVEDDEDVDVQGNVESLQRELEQAEEKFNSGVTNHCGSESESKFNSPLFSERENDDDRSHRSSSFIDLQQLLFSPAVGEDNDDNSSTNNKMGGSLSSSCSASLFSSSSSKFYRIVEIYETRSTQLKPQTEDQKEKVPIERMGIPFRKCRDPSCSCHHSSFKRKDNRRSRHRERNRAIIEKYHASNNQDAHANDEESNASESSQLRRRSALHRLQKQREKLLAMDYSDEDDRTEVTAGSSSSSSRYSGYSIRSDCQINTRKNHIIQNNRNSNHLDRRHRRQQSRSEDFDERFTNGGRVNTKLMSSDTLQLDIAQTENRMSLQLSPPTVTSHLPSRDGHEQKQMSQHQNQQPTPPPLPSRRSFGSKSNNKHTTYPPLLSQQRSQSLRKISSESFCDDNTTGTPRRCRSEDFIDGTVDGNIIESAHNRKDIKDRHAVFESNHRIPSKQASFSEGSITAPNTNTKKRSFSAHDENVLGPTIIPDEEDIDEGRGSKEGRNSLNGSSPTCIMEDVHHDATYPRSRTTQHEHENILKQLDRIHQQPESPNTDSFPNSKARSGSINFDDDPSFSRLFRERERNLKEYRKNIRLLQKEEKSDRCQKTISNNQKTSRRDRSNEEMRIRHQHQQRCFQRAMKMADLYHNMGLIHYQQGRYETARHVLQCGVDTLISNRASCVPFEHENFEESADPFDEDYSNPYFACAPSRLLPLLPTVDEAAPHLSNAALLLAAELILAQGNILAAQGSWKETKECSGRVLQWSVFQKQRLDNASFQQQHNHHYVAEQHNKYWRDWGPAIARAQVLFARCCEKEHRPDLAMGYYQEALSLQKSILSPQHIQAADTLYRMGNLHAASGLLGLAGQCYDEALCLYRRHKHLNGNEVEACVFADEATALAALGWIFLVQNDLERALALTKEALDGMIQALGPSHRNVFSLQHQLVCIQNSLAFPAHYENRGFVGQAHPYR